MPAESGNRYALVATGTGRFAMTLGRAITLGEWFGRGTKAAGATVATAEFAFGAGTGTELSTCLILAAGFEFATLTVTLRAAAKACRRLGITLGAPVAARGAVAE